MSIWLVLPSYQKANYPKHQKHNTPKTPKKATNFKVTLNIFRGYLQEKGLSEAELLTSKVKHCECMYVKLNYTFLNCYYILATHKNLLY